MNIKIENIVEKIDISKKITIDLLEKCNDKLYTIRENALKDIDKIIIEGGSNLKNTGLNDLFIILKDKINDSNSNIKKLTIDIIGKLVSGLKELSFK